MMVISAEENAASRTSITGIETVDKLANRGGHVRRRSKYTGRFEQNANEQYEEQFSQRIILKSLRAGD